MAKKSVEEILRSLRKYKGVELLEGYLKPDVSEYTTEIKCIEFYGIFERQK